MNRPITISLVLLSALAAQAQTRLEVTLVSGGDDLRGGNVAYMTIIRMDGGESREQVLCKGLAGGAAGIFNVDFPETIPLTNIRAFRIRHDGNPRDGHPFDTYDNWDLRRIIVSDRPSGTMLYDSNRDSRIFRSVVRFTGSLRTTFFFIRAMPSEPDFTISIVPPTLVSGPVLIRVRNVSSTTAGTIRDVNCTDSRETDYSTVSPIPLSPLGTIEVYTGIPYGGPGVGPLTCWVRGVDRPTAPSAVEWRTNNNVAIY